MTEDKTDPKETKKMSEDKSDRELIEELLQRVETLEREAPEDRMTIGVLSGNLDTTMAAFIIALGAVTYDIEVDLFFCFWGTAVLRDPKKSVDKNFTERMFGAMLPCGIKELPLSKMQMAGMGPVMIKKVIADHNAKTLEELFDDAAALGVRIHVCTLSMELMGIQKDELIDYPNMDFVGVGSFIDMASSSKQCWFM
jgi:peroxiredoxin family protein